MPYEWDEAKRLSNVRKHGIDFKDAIDIFEYDTLLMEDDCFDYRERRFLSIGLLRGYVIVVVHTEMAGVTRIISARKATKYEQRIYFERVID